MDPETQVKMARRGKGISFWSPAAPPARSGSFSGRDHRAIVERPPAASAAITLDDQWLVFR